jgi:hypothetical protein
MEADMKRCMLLFVLIVAAFAAAVSQGAAQTAPQVSDAVKAMVGGWEISNAERDRICTAQFRADAVKGGYRIDLDKNCTEAFSNLKDVQTWTVLNDVVRLIDAKGRTALEFTEVEGGMYESERAGGDGLYFLQSLAAVGPAPRTVEQMAGEWSILRAGKPICALTLASNEVGQDSYALRIKPGCDTAVTQFGPALWRMDRGELVLVAASGESWRFEAADNASWRRVPERANGLTMAKK